MTEDDVRRAKRGVGLLVATRREQRGWSQTELAERTGSSQRQISRVERYVKTLPRDGTMERLGEALGITPAEWYRAAGILPPPDETTPQPTPYREPVPAVFQDAFTELDLLSDEEIIAYVESKPGAAFRAEMARQKELRRTRPGSYARLCRAIMRAWTSNAQLAIDASLISEK